MVLVWIGHETELKLYEISIYYTVETTAHVSCNKLTPLYLFMCGSGPNVLTATLWGLVMLWDHQKTCNFSV